MEFISQIPNEQLITQSGNEILQFGALGVFLLASLFVNVVLWRSNIKKDERIDALQGARLSDAKEITEKQNQPLSEIVELSRLMYGILANGNKRGR